jgi:hypothetical protein
MQDLTPEAGRVERVPPVPAGSPDAPTPDHPSQPGGPGGPAPEFPPFETEAAYDETGGPPTVPEPESRILFLDDDPHRAETFLAWYPMAVWVQTSEECIAHLAHGWHEVHLDHDLAGEVYVDPERSDCGMEVVRWLSAELREPLRGTRFVIHSHNVDAARTMVQNLRQTGYDAHYRPFALDLDDMITVEDMRELFREAARRRRRDAWRDWPRRMLQAIWEFLSDRPAVEPSPASEGHGADANVLAEAEKESDIDTARPDQGT